MTTKQTQAQSDYQLTCWASDLRRVLAVYSPSDNPNYAATVRAYQRAMREIKIRRDKRLFRKLRSASPDAVKLLARYGRKGWPQYYGHNA